MARHHVLLAAGAVIFSAAAPAGAQVQVLGTSAARACFEAAKREGRPSSGDFQVCEDAVRRDATPFRDIVASHVNRGILSLRIGNIDAAMADFDRAMALDPDQPETYLNRGSALLRRDQAQPALTMFDLALAKRTKRPELAHYARAIAHESLGNVRAAYADYQRASELAPRWADPKRELTRFRVVPRQ